MEKRAAAAGIRGHADTKTAKNTNRETANSGRGQEDRKMASVRINGVDYDLRMSLWASEQIENEFGDLQEALRDFQKKKKISMVKTMFRILANGGRKHAGQPTDVQESVLDNCTLADLSTISTAMNEAMAETMHAETVNGNEADDQVADAYEAEYNEKNG